MKSRLFIFGIDGVPYRLMKTYSDKGVMPNFKKLREQGGIFCEMNSSIPDISSVSWSTIISGKNPGEHGIYGFVDLIPSSYLLTFPNFSSMKEKAYWLREDNKKHVIINVPSTYPAKPLNGFHVSGFVSLDLNKATFPVSFLSKLKKEKYAVDVDSALGHSDKNKFLEELFKILKKRTLIALDMWNEIDWDTFFFVVTGSDRIGHFMIDAFENEKHEYHKEFEDFYKEVDRSLGLFLKKLNPEDSIIILSDHGMESIKRNVYINAYLKKEGFLKLTKNQNNQHYNDIEPGTLAFSLDPGRIYLNFKEKYPKGHIKEDEKESTIKKLTGYLEKLEYNGEKVIKKVYRKEDIYYGFEIEDAPDLVLLPNKGFNLKGNINKDTVFEDPRVLIGKHTQEDAFFLLKTNKNIKIPKDFSVKNVLGIIDQIVGD